MYVIENEQGPYYNQSKCKPEMCPKQRLFVVGECIVKTCNDGDKHESSFKVCK